MLPGRGDARPVVVLTAATGDADLFARVRKRSGFLEPGAWTDEDAEDKVNKFMILSSDQVTGMGIDGAVPVVHERHVVRRRGLNE